jgi:murein DD-endopeptidase MepM/ murein hydrolase activator NlpD
MRWGVCFALLCAILFPRVALAQDEPPMYVFPFSRVPVTYPKDHLGYPAVDVEGCYARILAPTAGVISQLHRKDKWTPEEDAPGTRGGLTITLTGDDGVRYFFSHLGRIKVLMNQRVSAGDWIGVMGSSGNARVTRCHTHFGMSRVCPLAEVYLLQGEIWPQKYLDAWKNGEQLSPRKEIVKLQKKDPRGCTRSRADSRIDGTRSSG